MEGGSYSSQTTSILGIAITNLSRPCTMPRSARSWSGHIVQLSVDMTAFISSRQGISCSLGVTGLSYVFDLDPVPLRPPPRAAAATQARVPSSRDRAGQTDATSALLRTGSFPCYLDFASLRQFRRCRRPQRSDPWLDLPYRRGGSRRLRIARRAAAWSGVRVAFVFGAPWRLAAISQTR